MGPHKPVTQGLRSPLILSLWDPRFKKKNYIDPTVAKVWVCYVDTVYFKSYIS